MSAGKSQPVRTHPLICPDPVFIIGAPRSGTTILAHALGKHTHFWASDESEFLLDLYGGGRIEEAFDRACALEGDSWIRTEDVSRSEFLTFVSLGVNALFTSRSQGKRWIDHTNLYTHMAATLAEMFPQARFVHALRDGRQAVHSTLHFKQRFQSELSNDDGPPLRIRSWVAAGRIAPWAADFREACVVWSQYVEAATDFARRQPSRCITIRHEDLVVDPTAVFAALFTFLDVPFERLPVDFLRSTRINTSFPDLHKNSMPRRRLNDPWTEWTSEQQCVFLDVAGPTMVQTGYLHDQDHRRDSLATTQGVTTTS